MIWDQGAKTASRIDVTFGTYRELVERSRSFDAIAVMKPWQPTMTGPAEPERLDGQRVSASYFHVLGVSASAGTGLRFIRRPAQRPQGGNPQRRAVAAALRRRSARSSGARSRSTTTAIPSSA